MIEVNLPTLFVVALVAAGGAYFGAYLREKGKNLATKEDIDRIVRKTEEIKAEVSADAWLKQKRWDRKWECYVEMVRSLGEVHTLIRESIMLDAHSPDYAHQLEDRKRGVTEVLPEVSPARFHCSDRRRAECPDGFDAPRRRMEQVHLYRRAFG